ncbi:putative hemicentin-1 [Apostichopus japonicus]|uniref:Putative hemicentin-1 n=1 Tax=Stichopus japonicus TaxID=307972 RepID=A0A2G8LN43_STIJA|nr:putative hemicentin-1 [Apostichopus japonicus]
MATLRCFVDSMLPFTVEWRKGEEVIGMTDQFSESSLVEYDVGNAHSQVEGNYSCIAHSRDMEKPLMGRADTFLDVTGVTALDNCFPVTEPPPRILPPSNVTTVPGRDAILTCDISSTVPYNVTWDRPGSSHSLRLNTRVHLLRSGPSSSGTSVRRIPGDSVASPETREGTALTTFPSSFKPNVTFMAWDNTILTCTATGIPTPRMTWTKDGLPLPDDSRVVDFGDGRLFLRSMTPSLAGIYTCHAINDAGASEIPIYVSYSVPPTILEEVKQSYTVIETESVQLNCPAEGFPRPQIQWLFNGEPILNPGLDHFVDDQGSLSIPFAASENGGTYTCKVVNPAGQVSLDIALHVLGE